MFSMSIMFLVLNLLSAVALFIIGLSVLLRNSKDRLNIVYFVFSVDLIIWIISNFLSNLQSFDQATIRLLNHVVLSSAALALYILMVFIYLAIPSLNRFRNAIKYTFSFGIVVSLLALTPLVIKGVEKQGDVSAIEFNFLSPVYFLGILLPICLILLMLVIGLKKAKGLERNRLNIILWSIIGTVSIALLLNLLIPILTGSFALTNIGPIATLLLASGIAYSIVKHRLFNIRLIIARSLAYVFSVVSIVTLYTFIVFLISTLILENEITLKQGVFYSVFSIIIALLYQPVKKFFDKISNKIFYRDAYDAQELLNTVNSSIVSTINLQKLLESTAETIKANIKSSFCDFYIDSKTVLDFHNVGTNAALFNKEEWEPLLKVLEISKVKVFSEERNLNEKTSGLMHDLKIDVILRLTSQNQNVGYLVVGQKQSGSSFTSQDTQILEIIADEVAIAVQNTLRYEEIAQFNITLQGKIKDATAELQHTNQKLHELDEAKDEFISMASHQLRTPLTSVKGYISMLLENDAGKVNEQQRRFLNQAFISSQRMVYLIADLLNVSRLKTGKFVIESSPTYLPDVIESELAQLYETAKARGLELIYDKPKEFCTLNIDETKIRQVIMNFSDNAIHYTPKGGKITVELKQTDASVEFTVTDTGIGVPKVVQHKLFTKFYRAENAKKARPDGTGLGLFMAKKVVAAQGGAIIFKTEEGKGSTFGFSFPKAKLEILPTGK